MHDGYLFTIGICGSTSASGPAPACLDAMLAALPPVKRAALLGEVLEREDAPSLNDPLLAPIGVDIADAELLLFVTPLLGGMLPGRLRALAHATIEHPPPQRARFAAIVTIGAATEIGLASLRRLCAAAGATVVGELQLPADAELDPATRARLEELARAAYAAARRLQPAALPHQ